jgi:hypothetical protein
MSSRSIALGSIAALALIGGAVAGQQWIMPTAGAAAGSLPQQFNATDVNSLATALANAPPGSTISLAPGDYVMPELRRENAGALITITGPRSARLIRLVVRKPASNLRIKGVTLLTAIPNSQDFTGTAAIVLGADHIVFDDVLMSGVTPGDDPHDEQSVAMRIRDSNVVVVANSEIRHVKNISPLMDSRGVIFANNRLLDAREGLQLTNVRGVALRNNLFQGWKPRYDLGEHPDMIQIWNRDRPNGSMRVEISNNLLIAGHDRAVQGIFMRAEDFEKGATPNGYHRRFVIRNNIYYGSSKHGISLSNGHDMLVENNSVLASPNSTTGRVSDPAGRYSSGWTPFIGMLKTSTGIVRNNLASLIYFENPDAITADNNIAYVKNYNISIEKLLRGKLVPGDLPLSDFELLPNSVAGRKRIGADVSLVGPGLAKVDALALLAEADAMARIKDPDAVDEPVVKQATPRAISWLYHKVKAFKATVWQ